MTWLWRVLALVLLAAALWPELPRYAAERQLHQANRQLESALRKVQQSPHQAGADAQIREQAADALQLATQAAFALPDDPRCILAQALGLILSGQGKEAATLLEAAIARSERPEFTINLGRARTTQGDTAGAQAAYLRTAWASTQAIGTLPRVLREDLLRQVAELETQLRAGKRLAPPPLRPDPVP
jgi:hypothetical protein